jgi:NADH-quinone oxidoreductase E subunit
MQLKFRPEVLEEIAKIMERYPTNEAALLPVLHIAQREFGHVSIEAEEVVGEALGIPGPRVHGVSTFYSMFSNDPIGKYHVQVCTNVTCSLLGAEHIVKYLEKKLGIKIGETTPDDKFSLIEVECLGSCGTAPMMQINEEYYENLTEEKIDKILDALP